MVEINQRIEGTDIYVFSKDPATGLFAYSRPITADEGNELARQVTINGGLKATEDGFLYNIGVLYNMSTLKGIDANRKLMKATDGKVWFPTIPEGLLLDDAGLLPNWQLMDFGIALFDSREPDEEIAQALTETAKQRGYALPLLLSFKSLDLTEGGKRYGFTPSIVSADGLISGNDAVEALKRFRRVGDSGVLRVYHDDVGCWNACWDDILDSLNENCRGGRVSAIGSKKNLTDLVYSKVRQSIDEQRAGHRTQIGQLQARLQALDEQEKATLASAERVLQM